MKLLLTPADISNASIRKALVKLPGKPIAEANTPILASMTRSP